MKRNGNITCVFEERRKKIGKPLHITSWIHTLTWRKHIICSNPRVFIFNSKALTLQIPDLPLHQSDINVTKPSDFASDQAPCHKVNITEMHFSLTHIYSIILHPSARLSLLAPPPSPYLTSCSLMPLPTSPNSTHPSSPPLSPSLFLSIHTAESLLIICDLLKYIHCHSLSLSLSLVFSLTPTPSLSSLSLFLCVPGLLFNNLLALLIPSLVLPLQALSLSFVFLFCRIICVPLLPSFLCTAEKSQTCTVKCQSSFFFFCMRGSLLEEK